MYPFILGLTTTDLTGYFLTLRHWGTRKAVSSGGKMVKIFNILLDQQVVIQGKFVTG